MCAELMNSDRPKSADPRHSTSDEKIAVAEGSFAYCGRYEIDARQDWIVNQPVVAADPGYVGSRQVWPFRFDGGRLILSDKWQYESTCACEIPAYLAVSFKAGRLIQLELSAAE